jgi:DNA-binding response OmpR family regulator
MTKQILLVDADDLLRPSVASQLARQGFAPIQAASASAALALAAEPAPDLVLIDADLPDMPATDLCAELRRRWADLPLVVLGGEPAGQAALLSAGATEWIAKPFRFAHLSQRLSELLRQQAQGAAIEIGDYRFFPLGRLIVDARGRQIRLTEKEAAILAYLHRAGARPVGRDELLGEVWGYNGTVTTHTVETHIHRLRRKLGDGNPPVLRTEDGGYRLSASSTTTGT